MNVIRNTVILRRLRYWTVLHLVGHHRIQVHHACNRFLNQAEELKKEVSRFDVTTWIRLAEVCGEYLKKGHG